MTDQNAAAPFRVLGIALVVDQRGKEARTVLRYPTSTTNQQQQQQPRTSHHATGGAGAIEHPATTSPAAEEHLFYKLPGHQMAKLFRPKPSLCGRPMTLSVGGTVFCCCAVLMDENDKNSTTSKKNNKELSESGYQSSDEKITDEDLVLFSVIVALAPHIGTSLSSSIPTAGWMEAGYGPGMTTAADLLQGFHSYLDNSNGNLSNTSGTSTDPSEKRVSASFLSIRRVHVSLSRLCRILEREERRCRYVSVQANLFDQIRHDLTSSSNNSNDKYSYWQNHLNDATTISDSTDAAKHSEDLGGSTSRQQPLSAKASAALVSNTSAPETSSNLANSNHNSSPPLPPPSPVASPPPPSSSSVNIGTTSTSAAPTRHRRGGSNFTVSFDRDTSTPGNKNTSNTETSKKLQLQKKRNVCWNWSRSFWKLAWRHHPREPLSLFPMVAPQQAVREKIIPTIPQPSLNTWAIWHANWCKCTTHWVGTNTNFLRHLRHCCRVGMGSCTLIDTLPLPLRPFPQHP